MCGGGRLVARQWASGVSVNTLTLTREGACDLSEKCSVNNDLQEKSNTGEGEEDTEGYILVMEATR